MINKDRGFLIGILGLIILFSSCITNNKNDYSDSTLENIPTVLIDSLKSIGQLIQKNEIDPTKDNTIKGKNGTILYIAANSLVDENGKVVSSKTIIELKEHYSIVDYFTSNLQTVHNNEILQTQGMIYFSAKKADGIALKIDKSKPIRIEFPVNEKIDEAKIFTGKRDENGNLNWSEINEPSKYLVPYPIRFISEDRFPTECCNFYGIRKDTIKYKEINYYGDLDKFENTFLATKEFKERYHSDCSKEVLNIYINNIDKNLWEADELVVKHFIKDSIKRINFHINWKPPFGERDIRTKEGKESFINSEKRAAHNWVNLYRSFANQKLTKIDPTKRIPDTTLTEMTKAFVAYDALEFGWVNVDYFYKDPKATNIKLIAKTNVEAPLISLIIPNRNVILSGILKENNIYYFTKNEEGYNKLPKGEKAFILAISILNNKLHYAEKEIIIGQNETEIIELKQTSAEIIKEQMKKHI
jgi:hypothetical protein